MTREEGVGDVLKRRLAEHGLLKTFFASKICQAASEVSKGEFEPISFRNGALKVQVKSGGKGQFLKLRQNAVISEINEKLGSEQVKRLIILVKG